MARFRREIANEDGWSDWIRPLPNYRMACCDCSLVHTMDFDTDVDGHVIFRAKRNERSTAQMRRYEREKNKP